MTIRSTSTPTSTLAQPLGLFARYPALQIFVQSSVSFLGFLLMIILLA